MMMKDRNLILIALLGVGFYLMNRRQSMPVNQYPPAPPRNSPEWAYWARTVVDLAGGLAERLFGPGGPFEGKTKEEVSEAIQPTNQSETYYFYG